MKTFLNQYRMFRRLKAIGYYRFCWIPIDDKGNGIYSIIEFFTEELNLIDKNKIQILIL